MKYFFKEVLSYAHLFCDFAMNFLTCMFFRKGHRTGKFLQRDLIQCDFLSYIFNVSENTEIIHLIKMIWLFSFIISSFKLASGPPNDPGGSKEDIFKIKEMIHRIFSVKTNIEPVPK